MKEMIHDWREVLEPNKKNQKIEDMTISPPFFFSPAVDKILKNIKYRQT